MLHIVGVAVAGGAVYVGHLAAQWLDKKRRPPHPAPAAPPGDGVAARPEPDEAAGEAAQAVDRNLALAKVAMGLSAAGAVAYPPLSLLSMPVTLYGALDLFEDGYRGLVEERRCKASVLDAITVVGTLASGYYFVGALANWLYYFGVKLVQSTKDKSRQTLAQAFAVQPRPVWVLQEGCAEIETPFDALQVGHCVVVRAGELIPVDGLVVEGSAGIDQRMLTGESQPVERGPGERVFAATLALSGRIVVRVEEKGADTVAAQIGEMLRRTLDFKSTVELRSVDLSNRMALPTLGLGGVTWLALGFPSAIAVVGSNFSEVLRVTSPLGLLNYINLATREGILIKDGRSLELLTEVDTVVFDKTGTLTLEQPVVDRVYAFAGWDEDAVLAYAAAAEAHQTHPAAAAIREAAQARGLALPAIGEACCELGYGVQVDCQGLRVRVGSARFMARERVAISASAQVTQARASLEGHSLVYVALGHELAGFVELHAALRPEAKAVIQRLKARGLEVCIISGDQEAPTRRLAEAAGVDEYFAEVLPADKAEHVDRLQRQGRKVCFVGDGINDAVALKTANVSVSLNGASTAATDTAQIILMDKSLNQMDRVFALAEELKANLKITVATTVGPSLLCAGGVFLFHWKIMSTVLLYSASLAASAANAMLPALKRESVQPATPGTPGIIPAPAKAALRPAGAGDLRGRAFPIQRPIN